MVNFEKTINSKQMDFFKPMNIAENQPETKKTKGEVEKANDTLQQALVLDPDVESRLR